MPGYSTTPLWKKLGYKSDIRAFIDGAPDGYRELLLLPEEIHIRWVDHSEPGLEFAHVYAKKPADLIRKLTALRHQLAQDGVVWVSWPKKASGVKTEVTEETIREVALPMGYVDIKVCAVDEIWSGLKLVIRKTERRAT